MDSVIADERLKIGDVAQRSGLSLTLPRVNRVGFSCLAPIARYSWSCPLLFPELLHSNIRGEYETLRNAKYLVPIDGYDYYSLWLCQDFSELSVVNRDNHSGCLFLAIDNLFLRRSEHLTR